MWPWTSWSMFWAELKRLRKGNQMLRIERELLKKTAVYFAKDSQ